MYSPPQQKQSPNRLQNQHHYNQHCVCQICTCGKHSCPEPYTPFNADTSYHQDYKAYKVQSTGQQRYDYVPTTSKYDPNYLKSTYQAAYVGHPIQGQRMPTQKYQYRPNNNRFQDQTQYRKSYIPNKMAVEQPIRTADYIPNQTKFQGNTTYNAEYSPKPLTPYQSSKVEPYHANSVPFEGKTTYQSQYKPHKIESFRPDSNKGSRYVGSSSRFQGQSRYKEDYNQYRIQEQRHCPVQVLPSRPLKCSPGNAEKHKWD